jgi:hypothetical protein
MVLAWQSVPMRFGLTCRFSSVLPRGETWVRVAIQVSARLVALLISALSVFLQIFCDDGSRSSDKQCDLIIVAGIYAFLAGAIGNLWMFCLAAFTFLFAVDLIPNGISDHSARMVINVYLLFSALAALWICHRQFCASLSEARIQNPYVPVSTTGESIEIV